MENGCKDEYLSDFFGYFFIRKCMWSTPDTVKSTIASLKKFYRLSKEDYEELLESDYTNNSIEKLWFDQNETFQSLYYMNNHFNQEEFIKKIDTIFSDQECGHVMRVKGFYQKENKWYEMNMTQESKTIQEIPEGQDVIIVIGEELNKTKIDQYFK